MTSLTKFAVKSWFGQQSVTQTGVPSAKSRPSTRASKIFFVACSPRCIASRLQQRDGGPKGIRFPRQVNNRTGQNATKLLGWAGMLDDQDHQTTNPSLCFWQGAQLHPSKPCSSQRARSCEGQRVQFGLKHAEPMGTTKLCAWTHIHTHTTSCQITALTALSLVSLMGWVLENQGNIRQVNTPQPQ